MINIKSLFGSKALDTSRHHEAEPPLKVFIGTCLGSYKDAEYMARGYVERYFDVPGRSWIFLKKESGVGVHFEIHEGGDGRPYLPSILERFHKKEKIAEEKLLSKEGDGNEDSGSDESEHHVHKGNNNLESIFIRPKKGRFLEVIRKEDGVLVGIMHSSEEEPENVTSDSLFKSTSAHSMKPYLSVGSEFIKVGLMFASLGLLTISIAGIVHKSFTLSASGFAEAVESMPINKVMGIKDPSGEQYSYYTLPNDKLPLVQMEMFNSQFFDKDKIVTKFFYENGKWDFVMKDLNGENSVFPDRKLTDDSALSH